VAENVTVGLVGDPVEQVGTRITRFEWERDWSERPQVTLKVDPSELLSSIVERAFIALEVPDSPHGISSHHSVDIALYEPEQKAPRAWDLTLVDDRGRAVWTSYDLRLIPYGELRRAVEHGAVPGDPSRLYLVFKEAVGNGAAIDWPTLLHAWRAVDPIIVRIGEYGGATTAVAAIYKLIRSRLASGRKAAEPEVLGWAQRGAWPYTVRRFLGEREWEPLHLSRLLGCSETQAEDVLAVFGFAPGDDNRWRHNGDEAGRLLGLILDELSEMYVDPADEAWTQVEERLESLLTTGERRPYDYSIDTYPSWQGVEQRERIKKGLWASGLAGAAFFAGLAARRRRS
jgi:hypothetical protein